MDKQHLTNSEHLAKLILDMGVPANDASTALLPHKLTVSGMSRTGLADALGDLVPKITKGTAHNGTLGNFSFGPRSIISQTVPACHRTSIWDSPNSCS